MVEGARLESEYTPKAYRGFESLPLRQAVSVISFSGGTSQKTTRFRAPAGQKRSCEINRKGILAHSPPEFSVSLQISTVSISRPRCPPQDGPGFTHRLDLEFPASRENNTNRSEKIAAVCCLSLGIQPISSDLSTSVSREFSHLSTASSLWDQGIQMCHIFSDNRAGGVYVNGHFVAMRILHLPLALEKHSIQESEGQRGP